MREFLLRSLPDRRGKSEYIPWQRYKRKSVVLDANVLINLLTADQLSILPELDHYRFLVPNHVLDEVHRKAQRQRLRKALKVGWLEEVEIVDLTEMELYAEYRARFGEGESACMAVARSRGWIVASDERAVRKELVPCLL